MPLVTGNEASGTIVAVHPSVHGFKVGDRIGYMSSSRGAYAQYNVITPSTCIKLPDSISTKVAAASMLQGLTAVTFVHEAIAVKQGDWVLVHAAAGGVGIILCELCSAMGAKVIGTAGTPEKIEVAKQNGAEWCISSRLSHDEMVAKIKEITRGHGIDAVFDGVGKATFEVDLEIAARKATLCVFGNASGSVPPVDILRLGAPKNLKLCRPVVFGYLATPEEFDKYATKLLDLIQKGVIKLERTKTYALADAVQAHLDLEGRQTTGKLLLEVP
jgi:NADPH:quinone reductase